MGLHERRGPLLVFTSRTVTYFGPTHGFECSSSSIVDYFISPHSKLLSQRTYTTGSEGSFRDVKDSRGEIRDRR